jgi:hypothetical protein
MKPLKPNTVSAERLAKLANIVLPGQDMLDDDSPPPSPRRGRINQTLYLQMVKLNPDNLALAALYLRDKKIDEAEYRRRKRFLFYKLMGEYNAAIMVMRRGFALDPELFLQVFTHDPCRLDLFSSFSSESLARGAFIDADKIRVKELIEVYRGKLTELAENGGPIQDISREMLELED